MNGLKNEIELAKKQEEKNAPDDCNYGNACYDSAYKAFESLLNDNHSGMSIRITKSILDRLIDNKPLTPIYDDKEEWNSLDYYVNEKNMDTKNINASDYVLYLKKSILMELLNMMMLIIALLKMLIINMGETAVIIVVL